MGKRVCPWWLGYLLASPLRRLSCDPAKLLAAYVTEGMTILEPGPGMGFFTLELARRAGSKGRVVAIDIQPRMLAGLKRRTSRAGVGDRVQTRLAMSNSLGIGDLAGTVDFALAFAMVHELPETGSFFQEVAAALKPGAVLLLAEPTGHVKAGEFDAELSAAARAGLVEVERPRIGSSRAALLRKA
jgi:SAM-dependent methyltransferase